MKDSISRRHFLAGAVAVGLTATGCKKEATVEAPQNSVADSAAEGWCITGIMIGERLFKFPHPAIRVLGAVLVVSGTLVLTYLAVNDKAEKTEQVKLTEDETTKLLERRKVVLVRQDGKIEERAIDRVESPGDAGR